MYFTIYKYEILLKMYKKTQISLFIYLHSEKNLYDLLKMAQ